MTGPISETNDRLACRRSRGRARRARSACSRRLDVLDDPGVGAVVVARAQVVDHPLERAARGAHALDRRDLALDREDRLDLQRAAEPGLRGADPPAAAQELERVDREPDLRGARAPPRTRAATASTSAARAAPPRRPASATRPIAAAGAARVDDLDALAAACARPGRSPAWRADSTVPEMPPRDVDRDDVAARLDAAARRPRGSRRSTAARSSAAASAVRRRS